MIGSGSVCSLITMTLANKVLKTTPFANWITTKQDRNLKTFSHEPIKILGNIATTLKYKDWTCDEACLTVAEAGHKLVIERDLFNSLGLAVVQQNAKKGKCVNTIDNSTCKVNETIASQFPHLV